MADCAKQRAANARRRLSLIKALARTDAVTSWSTGPDNVRLLSIASSQGRKLAAASSAEISALASAGILAAVTDRPALTPAGLAWLRRHLAATGSDDDPFQAQHRDIHRRSLQGPRIPAPLVRVNDAESPLAWLRHRKKSDGKAMLDDNQFTAGERLRSDYTFAALLPRVTADWTTIASGGGRRPGGAPAGAMRDEVVAAKERVNRALAAVGPELGRILVDVCCLLKGIETAEKNQSLPRRSGKVVLQLALTALARHYGLTSGARRAPLGDGLLHWGQPDYRPSL